MPRVRPDTNLGGDRAILEALADVVVCAWPAHFAAAMDSDVLSHSVFAVVLE
jgi:hypothetical protein